MDFDWKGLVKTVAPAIGTALGGPLGGLAMGTVAKAILGPDQEASEDRIAAALEGAGPDALLKLKQADAEFRQAIKKLDVDLEQLANQDRAGARAREIALRGWANPVLAGVVVTGFFAICAYVIAGQWHVDEQKATLIGAVIGYASAKADQVVSYYFGSSRGSERKTELMMLGATKGKG